MFAEYSEALIKQALFVARKLQQLIPNVRKEELDPGSASWQHVVDGCISVGDPQRSAFGWVSSWGKQKKTGVVDWIHNCHAPMLRLYGDLKISHRIYEVHRGTHYLSTTNHQRHEIEPTRAASLGGCCVHGPQPDDVPQRFSATATEQAAVAGCALCCDTRCFWPSSNLTISP